MYPHSQSITLPWGGDTHAALSGTAVPVMNYLYIHTGSVWCLCIHKFSLLKMASKLSTSTGSKRELVHNRHVNDNTSWE